MQEVPVVKEFKELPKLWRGRRRQVPIKHRKEAIQRALSGLESTRDIAESYGVSCSAVNLWVRNAAKKDKMTEQPEQEIKKENSAGIKIALLENEIAFLKRLVKMLLDEKGITL